MSYRTPKIGGSGTYEGAQRATVAALAREGVDTAPAAALEGHELDAWIDAAEEALFDKTHREMMEQLIKKLA